MLYKLLWKWRGIIVIAATIFIVLSQFLVGDRAFIHTDATTRLYPLFKFYGASIRSGDSFLWNPYIFSGFPSFASIVGGFLSPFVYGAAWVMGGVGAYHILLWVFIVFAALGVFSLLRKMAVSILGSTIGGLVYVLSQWAAVHDLGIVESWFLLPWLFVALLQYYRTGCFRWILFGAGAFVLVVVSGNPQYFIQGVATVFLFALFLSFSDEYYSWRPIGGVVAIFFIGGVIALMSIVPTFLFVELSAVKSGAVNHWAATVSGLRVGDLFHLILPIDSAVLPLSLARFYIGILPLLWVGYALQFRRTMRGFYSWILLGSIALSLTYSPLFWLLHHLPGISVLRFSFRWMTVAGFAAAVLSGFGFDIWLRSMKNKRCYGEALFQRFFLVIASIFSLGSIFSFAVLYVWKGAVLTYIFRYFDTQRYSYTTQLPLSYYHNYLERLFLDAVSLFDPLRFRFLGAFIAVLLSCWILRESKRISPYLRWQAAGIVFLNFVMVFSVYNNSVATDALLSVPATVAVLKEEHQPVKVFSFMGGQARFERLDIASLGKRASEDVALFNNALLYPDTNLYYGIFSSESYEPLMSKNMARLLAYLGSDRAESAEIKFTNERSSLDEKIFVFKSRKPILDLLGITHITSSYDLGDNPWSKVFETNVTAQRIPAIIYHNQSARPPYYFTNEEWLLNLDNETSPVKLQEILEANVAAIHQTNIRLQNQKNTELRFKTSNPKAQLLVVSQNNLPGWRAWIDNAEAPIHTFGTVFQALRVPAGDHEIVLRYEYWEIWRYALRNKLGINI